MKTLLPLSTFVKNTVGPGYYSNPTEAITKLDKIKRYTHFLESRPELSMFVPCTGPGKPAVLNEFEIPEDDYQMAVDNLIFKDFKVIFKDGKPSHINNGVVSVFWYDSITNTWNPSRGVYTLDDLTIYSIEMVEDYNI
jgi:hypothetical protein